MTRAIEHLCTYQPFTHIDPARLAVTFSQCKSNTKYGMYAKVVPMRFEGGAFEKLSKRYRWVWPRFRVAGVEKLYLVSFYLPRFLEIDAREKLATIVHELYHISPECDGDLRRFPGKNYAHGHSREAYDAALVPVCEAIERAGGLESFAMFSHSFRQLVDRFGGITGAQYRGLSPKRFNRF